MGDKRKMTIEMYEEVMKCLQIDKCRELIINQDQKITELEKENAELKAEVKEWKDKADLWCKTANLKDHNIMINKELEKENAELKLKLEALEGQTPWKDIKDKSEVIGKLTKAKDLLAKWVELFKPKSVTALPTPIQVDTE